MKKVSVVLAIALFTVALTVSCEEKENTLADEIQQIDNDEVKEGDI